MGFKLQHTATAPLKEKSTVGSRLEQLLQKELRIGGTLFSTRRKADFYSELAVLLHAGVQLREGLELFTQSQTRERFRAYLEGMIHDLDQGSPFSEVIRRREDFSAYEHYSLRIGEESGNLAEVVNQLGRYFTQRREQGRELMSALTYPIIILATALLVVVFMLRMVVPMFEDIFRQNGVELPALTQGIISISQFLESYGGWMLLLAVGCFPLFKAVGRNTNYQRSRDAFLMKLPAVKRFIKTLYSAQYTQAMALLCSSDVPVLQATQMVRAMIAFYPMQKALETVENALLKGDSLHQSIIKGGFFDQKMASLIKVADETNQTQYVFNQLSEQYAADLKRHSKLLSTLMEPLIIVVIGLFVGVILVAMYLPMFRLNSVLA